MSGWLHLAARVVSHSADGKIVFAETLASKPQKLAIPRDVISETADLTPGVVGFYADADWLIEKRLAKGNPRGRTA